MAAIKTSRTKVKKSSEPKAAAQGKASREKNCSWAGTATRRANPEVVSQRKKRNMTDEELLIILKKAQRELS